MDERSDPATVRLGVVTSLRWKGEWLRHFENGSAPLVFASDGTAGQARRGAEQLAVQGVSALVSFGPAIGLAPVLRPGDLVVAESVVLPSGKAVRTDPAWRGELVRQMVASDLHLRVVRIAGRDTAVGSAAEKRKAFQASFAAALDTESHAVAEVACAAGLPFLAVRAIADPAEESQPFAVRLPAIDGALASALAMLGGLLRRPWEVPALWRGARNGRLACAALRRAAAALPLPTDAPAG